MGVIEGVAACAVSALLFGSMFVPVHKYDAADGIFAQWMMSMGILFMGMIAYAHHSFESGLFFLPMIGGFFWTIGNATAIPIINRLGMALGILIWNTTNCLTGWACSRFGLFGLKANPPASPLLNYGGLFCVLIGGVLFSRVKGTEQESGSSVETKEHGEAFEKEKLTTPSDELQTESGQCSPSSQQDNEVPLVVQPRQSRLQQLCGKRLVGILLALVAGVFYAFTFYPANYIINNPEAHSGFYMDGLHYVPSVYAGIFLTSTVIFVIYAIVTCNKPKVNPQLALPAFLAGILWGIAQTSFFIANDNLPQTVTFPIITMLPGCIASVWSIFFFKEIRGQRNFTILAIAITVTLTGALLVALSKDIEL